MNSHKNLKWTRFSSSLFDQIDKLQPRAQPRLPSRQNVDNLVKQMMDSAREKRAKRQQQVDARERENAVISRLNELGYSYVLLADALREFYNGQPRYLLPDSEWPKKQSEQIDYLADRLEKQFERFGAHSRSKK